VIYTLPKQYHPDFSNPRVKPKGQVEIDWSNPVTRGLKRYWLGNNLVDLVAGSHLSPAGSGLAEVVVDKGSKTFKFQTSGTTGGLVDFAITPINGSQNRTFLGEIFHTDSNNGYILNINPTSGGSGSTGDRWAVRVDTSTGLRVEIQGSGYTSSLAANTGAHFVGCKLNGTTLGDHTLYVDGSNESASGANSVSTNATYSARLGSRDNEGVIDPVEFIKWGALWGRALSDREIESIRLNPYQVLKPKNDPVYFVPSGVIGINIPVIMNHMRNQGIS